jgi:hypothetical protein
MGSAGKGLCFFYIELPKAETTRWLNLSNCGVVKIIRGSISLAELEKELSDFFFQNLAMANQGVDPCQIPDQISSSSKSV